MKNRPEPLRDRHVELVAGIALFVAGAYLVYDSYEGRGVRRPFPARFLLP